MTARYLFAVAPAEPAGSARSMTTSDPVATAPAEPAGGARQTTTSDPVAAAPAEPAGGARSTTTRDPLPSPFSPLPVLRVASCGPDHEFEYGLWLVTAWAGRVHVHWAGPRARIF